MLTEANLHVTFTPAPVEPTIYLVKVLLCARGYIYVDTGGKCGSSRGQLKREGVCRRRGGFNREVGLKRAFTIIDLLAMLQKSLDRVLFLNFCHAWFD